MRKEAVAIFGGSFNPPGVHHVMIVYHLLRVFEKVVVIPCGFRPDKNSSGEITNEQRWEIVKLAFGGIENVVVDSVDILSGKNFMRTFDLDIYAKEKYGNVWHVVGKDLILNGGVGKSLIQSSWYRGDEIWNNLKFCVLSRDGVPDSLDMPPKSVLINMKVVGASTEIRNRLQNGSDVEKLLPRKVYQFIKKNNLYI